MSYNSISRDNQAWEWVHSKLIMASACNKAREIVRHESGLTAECASRPAHCHGEAKPCKALVASRCPAEQRQRGKVCRDAVHDHRGYQNSATALNWDLHGSIESAQGIGRETQSDGRQWDHVAPVSKRAAWSAATGWFMCQPHSNRGKRLAQHRCTQGALLDELQALLSMRFVCDVCHDQSACCSVTSVCC